MASIEETRRKIQSLEKEISELRRARNQTQEELNRVMSAKIIEIQRRYEKRLNCQLHETEESYLARLREFKERASMETEEEYKRLREQVNRIVCEQESKISELTNCNEELTRLLRQFRDDAKKTADVHREKAKEYLRKAESSRDLAKETPHEFFCQGEYSTIDSHLMQVQDQLRLGMFQSALADAAGISLEFDLLKIKVENALEIWEEAYREYKNIIDALNQRIFLMENMQIETQAGTFRMSLKELDYWSSGKYLDFREKIMQELKNIECIDQDGISNHLKKLKSSNSKGIFEKINEAEHWQDEMTAISSCIISERKLSDARWVYGQSISKSLEERGYCHIEKGFRNSVEVLIEDGQNGEVPIGTRPKENPLDCYRINASIHDKGIPDLMTISIFPVRQNGVAIRNECIVTYRPETVVEARHVQSLVDQGASVVLSLSPKIRINKVNPLTNKNDLLLLEGRIKRMQPDPDEQIRYRERKHLSRAKGATT